MNNRQNKAKCSNILCLCVFPLNEAQYTLELDTSGRKVQKIYCKMCFNSELIRSRDLNRNES